jgi:uncharacterized membrane protein YfcA
MGMVDWHMLMSLLAGSVPFVVLGSLLARRISGRRIQIVLAVVLMAAEVKILMRPDPPDPELTRLRGRLTVTDDGAPPCPTCPMPSR